MMAGSISGITPRERIVGECARRGKDAVAEDCIALLQGETDPDLLRSLIGAGADKFYDGQEHKDMYWFRVWALRGLLWSWDARAADLVREALSDESWRVREMAAKVVARNLVGEAMSAVAVLYDDPVPRVRSAAERAVIRLTSADGEQVRNTPASEPRAMDRADVQMWVAGYERLWRRAGTDLVGELFTPDASYRPSPWSQAVDGLGAIARFWEAERSGPDEAFTMTSDVVAVDGPTAVVRVCVEYGAGESWRDLWVLHFADDGRCSSFEEWPFAPDQDTGHLGS